ncbi:hypothetical protein VCHC37A1_3124B, partial [Vibrio cholerae HC-37A1]
SRGTVNAWRFQSH